MSESPDRASFWDERFAQDEYVFGTQPNAFVAREAERLAPGSSILAIADGEGRNSVFLAQQGHQLVATDISKQGLIKARRLAAERKVEVSFQHVDLLDWEWPEAEYDVVLAIFVQFAGPPGRDAIFAGMKKAVKPGGLILLQGYRPEQLSYGTGGPPLAENMYTEALLRETFADFEIAHFASYDAEIAEGDGHAGMSALIDLIARRPVISE